MWQRKTITVELTSTEFGHLLGFAKRAMELQERRAFVGHDLAVPIMDCQRKIAERAWRKMLMAWHGKTVEEQRALMAEWKER